jgi:light-regulated signal transduction histidine kinase (bacteriophytochrome)
LSNQSSLSNWPRVVQAAVFEVRTPLLVVVGYARVLLAGRVGDLTEKQREVLEHMVTSVERIRHVVDQMEFLSRLEVRGAPELSAEVPLSRLLPEVMADIPRIEEAGAVDLLVVPGKDQVGGSYELLRQALAGVARSVIVHQLHRKRPLGIWVVDPPTATTERWIVMAAGDQIAEAAALSPERLTELADSGPLSLDIPFADRVVRAHGGRLRGLPDDLAGVVIALPKP